MKRPNVARMRRAVERDERARLLRHREFRVDLTDEFLDSSEAAQAQARAWLDRVGRYFPHVNVTTWRDHHKDQLVVRWDLDDAPAHPSAWEVVARRYWRD